ncbi:hypothetical protein B0H11DRAFT_2003571 [Mycena galericulata]|nr:hypothetical protein B0H11DRAFT_2003571 [Mycena galericulata]
MVLFPPPSVSCSPAPLPTHVLFSRPPSRLYSRTVSTLSTPAPSNPSSFLPLSPSSFLSSLSTTRRTTRVRFRFRRCWCYPSPSSVYLAFHHSSFLLCSPPLSRLVPQPCLPPLAHSFGFAPPPHPVSECLLPRRFPMSSSLDHRPPRLVVDDPYSTRSLPPFLPTFSFLPLPLPSDPY